MRTLIKKLITSLGYEITRKHYSEDHTRSSMQKSIEWLRTNHFDVKTVLDVGASDGRWSKDCMNHFTNSHYILFEPQLCHSDALDYLEEKSGGKVSVVKKAVGPVSGKTFFDVTDPLGGALTYAKTENTVEVSLTSIDDYIIEEELKGPFLIKLDTHGFEIPILEGATKTLDDCSILIIEAYNYNIAPESVLFWQLCEYLNKRGFRPIDIVDIMYREYDNSFWQMDIVFVKLTWPGYKHISYK